MAVRALRRGFVAVCLIGIPGMIVTSIADATGGALAFGLAIAVAVTGLILVTAVTAPSPGAALAEEAAAERVEAEVATLAAQGVDEAGLRRLVRSSVRLGWVRGRSEAAAGHPDDRGPDAPRPET